MTYRCSIEVYVSAEDARAAAVVADEMIRDNFEAFVWEVTDDAGATTTVDLEDAPTT